MTLQTGRYRHYKGQYYWVLGVGTHTETGEELVVYIPLYLNDGPHQMCVRPLAMFIEEVKVDGKLMSRFTRIDP